MPKKSNEITISGFLIILTIGNCLGLRPTFRILAPQFICGSPTADSNTTSDIPVSIPGATTIRLQTASGQQLSYNWTVRFKILNSPRGQRFNLLVWRVVRNLEKTLSDMGPEISENNLVAINNTLLIEGVTYVFNISGFNNEGQMGDMKSFGIKFTDAKTEPKFDVGSEESDDQFSVIILSSDTTYADVTYYVEAEVTPCKPTNDYYFEWIVTDLKGNVQIKIGQPKGKRLTIRPNTLIGGHEYDISCKIFKITTDKLIISNGLFLTVLKKGISVEMNMERMTMATGLPVTISSKIINPDNIQGTPHYDWKCKLVDTLENNCNGFESIDQSELNYERGFDKEATYNIELVITLGELRASKTVILIIKNAFLPVIDIVTSPFYATTGLPVEIEARVFELRATCKLYWMALNESGYEELDPKEIPGGFGKNLSVNSYEETFLSELVEFGNETIHRNFPLNIPGPVGDWKGLKPDTKYKFRLFIECSCPTTMECEDPKNVTAFSDVTVLTNAEPVPRSITVTPTSGMALKDIFKFSTKPATDITKDYPLTYTFGYRNGNQELIKLPSYIESLTVETILPYSENPLIPTLDVCDSRKACSHIEGEPIKILKPNSISQEELEFYLKKFETQLIRNEYYDAFYSIPIILNSLKLIDNQNLVKYFEAGYENITRENVIKQRNNVVKNINIESANDFIIFFNKFIEKYKVSDTLIQEVLKLRDEAFEAVSQTTNIRSVRSLFYNNNKSRNKRGITPNDVKSYVEMSEYVILSSENPKDVLKEKNNILSKLEMSISDLCKLRQKIILDWELVSLSIEMFNLKPNLGSFHIPYPFNKNRKIPEGNVAVMEIVVSNNIRRPIPHCIERSTFSINFLNDNDYNRKGWIYHSIIYDFENLSNFEIMLKIPVNDLDIKMNNIIECRRWKNKIWDGDTCVSNDKLANINGINYIICKCDTFGYFSLYVSQKKDFHEAVDDIINNTERITTTENYTNLTTEYSVDNCGEISPCLDNISKSDIALRSEHAKILLWILLPCVFIGITCSVLCVTLTLMKKKKISTIKNMGKIEKDVPRYSKYHDEYLMEGSLEILGKYNGIYDNS